MGQSIQTIHILGKKPNKVYHPFLKAGLGYKNPERLKKAIAAQPKMYDGEMLHSAKLNIDSPDSEETLEDAEETTQTQHQKELDELIEHVNQKTYAYADVRAQNQDLLITISELKNKLQTVDKGKTVNTKFDKSETSGTLLCVTPLPKNIAVKAKKVSTTKVKTDRSNQALHILHLKTSKVESTMRMYLQEECVESSNSVGRQKSKATKSKDRVLKNKTDKRPSAHVRKMSSSVSIDSNKRETMHSNLRIVVWGCYNDGSNIVCVSCGKDVFLLSHENCVARYALSRNSSVKIALFTTLIATKSKNLGATSIVAKSRLSVAKTTTATNKVIQLVLWIVDSGCLKSMTGNLQLLRNFVEKFMGRVRFGNDHFAAITGYGDYVQDGDLEVAFRSNTCYVRNLEGDDLLTGSRDSNLYTISISEMAASSPVCLMSRATSTKS
ncbi:hypothetical protein Tco_0527928 [Tanacetum coccineum]